MKDFTYKPCSVEYKGQVIDLLDNLWHFSKEEKIKYFKWKYEDNPFSKDIKGYIALDGEKVVAFRGYMVQPMRLQDKIFFNAQLADTVTHLEYRRMGLFRAITDYSLKELEKDSDFGVSLNSSSGGPTLGGYLKLGWKPISEREHIFRLSVRGCIKMLIRKKMAFKDLEYSTGQKHYILCGENRPNDIASIPYDYKRISHLHSSDYYSWRLSNPRNIFRFAYLYENESLKAYVIFVDLGKGRFDIIDFNCFQEKYLKEILDFFVKKEEPLYITLWTVGKTNTIYNNFKDFGFIALNKLLRNIKKFQKPPFLVREICRLGLNVFDEKIWDLNKITADEI